MSELRVDGERLWASLMEMAQVGATPEGGCRRLALTDEDKDGLELFRSWAAAAGCEIGRDEIGNLFAERPGSDPDRPAVFVGSHLDTQPSGGKFDGACGARGARARLCGLRRAAARGAGARGGSSRADAG